MSPFKFKTIFVAFPNGTFAGRRSVVKWKSPGLERSQLGSQPRNMFLNSHLIWEKSLHLPSIWIPSFVRKSRRTRWTVKSFSAPAFTVYWSKFLPLLFSRKPQQVFVCKCSHEKIWCMTLLKWLHHFPNSDSMYQTNCILCIDHFTTKFLLLVCFGNSKRNRSCGPCLGTNPPTLFQAMS